jgi:phosphoadenosine phosphosulfate reductase
MRNADEVVSWGCREFGDRFAVVTALQKEGLVLLDLAARVNPRVRVITIDTGRLPAETHALIESIQQRYGVTVERLLPDPLEVDRMVARHGPDLFRTDVALRKLCCQVRKVRPLAKALDGLDAYAVGLRRGQSEGREHVEQVNQVDGRWKLSPLAYWTAEQVDAYIREHDLPVHPLYAQGYRSIGCAPCTRPVGETEDERAGRWWWETESDKECGLHFTPEGKLVRTVDVLLQELVGSNA